MRTNPITIFYFLNFTSWVSFTRSKRYILWSIDIYFWSIFAYALDILAILNKSGGWSDAMKSWRISKSSRQCRFFTPWLHWLLKIKPRTWRFFVNILKRVFFFIQLLIFSGVIIGRINFLCCLCIWFNSLFRISHKIREPIQFLCWFFLVLLDNIINILEHIPT